jgi:hypothetical protein
MANRWIEFVRKWAAKAGISYACAVSKPECRAEYQAIYGNRKKLPRKTEREMMGQEDIRSQAVRTLEKQKKKKPDLIIESDSEEEYIITPKKKEKKQKKSQKSVATERVSPKLKPVMDKLKMLQEDLQSQMVMKKQMTASLRSKLSNELKTVLDEKKRLVELSRMMGEDRDAPPALKAEVQKIEKKMDSLTKYAIASKAKKMELKRQGINIPRLKNAEELAKEAKEAKEAKKTKLIIEESDDEKEDIPTGTADEIANQIYISMPRVLVIGTASVGEKEKIRKEFERIEKIIERSFKDKKINKKEYNALKGDKMLGFLKTKIDEEEVITPAPKKKKAPASVESQKAEKGENVEIVSKHLIDEILKTQEKIADWELNNIMLVAKARVDGGFTLDDEKKVKKLPRDELRSWYRKSGKKTRFDDVYSINTAPKNIILDYLFNWDSITDTEDWGALKRDLDALSVAPTQKALKIPVKLNAKGREFILKEINSYLFRPQVLELTRFLGITPSKKDTKIDTAPLILQKLEEGEIDLNDVFKGIRTLEKNFHNTDAIKARQKGRYSPWKYDDETQRLLKREKGFYLKRELDFGIFDYSKNFGNPDDPTDYVKLLSNWFEKEGVGFEKEGVAPKKKTAKEIKKVSTPEFQEFIDLIKPKTSNGEDERAIKIFEEIEPKIFNDDKTIKDVEKADADLNRMFDYKRGADQYRNRFIQEIRDEFLKRKISEIKHKKEREEEFDKLLRKIGRLSKEDFEKASEKLLGEVWKGKKTEFYKKLKKLFDEKKMYPIDLKRAIPSGKKKKTSLFGEEEDDGNESESSISSEED